MTTTSQRVLNVHHWSEHLFTFRTTRDAGLRFENGHFAMLGLQIEGRPCLRAYSIASANHDECLEFLSIKVPDGALTSRLQHLQVGDSVLVGRKPTGTLVLHDLLPGSTLYLLCTGTGLAPFMSIIQDPITYERFEKVVLVHGVRFVRELAYADVITRDLPNHEFLGDEIRAKLLYYPTVTRESFQHRGRVTTLLETGQLFTDLGLPPLDSKRDRVMICGSPSMLKDVRSILDLREFKISPHAGVPGDYVIERAFAEK